MDDAAKPPETEAEQSAKSVVDEVKVFVLTDHLVTTVKGDTKHCEKTSFGQERAIVYLLRDVLKTLVETGVFRIDAGANEQEMELKLIGVLFEQMPDKLAEMVSIIVKEPMEWVEQNLDIEVVVKLLVPFLLSKRMAVEAILRPHWTAMQRMMNGT